MASAVSVWVYRDALARVEGLPLVPSLIATLLGGLAGALLLLWTPSSLFDRVLPWLLLTATLTLTFGPRLDPLLRARFQAGPAVVVTIISGEKGTTNLLLLSQVILSLQLSFAVFPLVMFTSDKVKMGEFVNGIVVKCLAWGVATIIALLNAWLLLQTFRNWFAA